MALFLLWNRDFLDFLLFGVPVLDNDGVSLDVASLFVVMVTLTLASAPSDKATMRLLDDEEEALVSVVGAGAMIEMSVFVVFGYCSG